LIARGVNSVQTVPPKLFILSAHFPWKPSDPWWTNNYFLASRTRKLWQTVSLLTVRKRRFFVENWSSSEQKTNHQRDQNKNQNDSKVIFEGWNWKRNIFSIDKLVGLAAQFFINFAPIFQVFHKVKCLITKKYKIKKSDGIFAILLFLCYISETSVKSQKNLLF
jgi:hypothetical protein